MLIKRNSPLCGKCKIEKDCDCICHIKDVIESKHFEIHEDNMNYIVKAVVDLDHFR